MKQEKWLLCPVCGNKTRLKLCEDTILENFPLYCPKCKQETLMKPRKESVIYDKSRAAYKMITVS